MKADKEQNKPEQEKPKKGNKLERQIIVMLIILGLILVSFLAAYEIFKPKPYFKYYDFTVKAVRFGNSSLVFYLIPIPETNKNALLSNDPRKINVSVDVDGLLSGVKKVWITMPPDLRSDAVAAGHELEVFTSRTGFDTSFGLTNSTTDVVPTITCENATQDTRVFMLDVGNETKVYRKGYCIIVQGNNYKGLMEATDALILDWLFRIAPI